MKFIILVSNLKEISPSVFFWKKIINKKLRCNSTVKIWFCRKKTLNYTYLLKNGVGRYNIFFSYKIRQCFCSIPRFDLCHVLSSPTNNFAHAQTLSRMSSLSGRMDIARVNIGFFTGFKKIKQRRIFFAIGYLRMILWKISTAISIKHRILATFNMGRSPNYGRNSNILIPDPYH